MRLRTLLGAVLLAAAMASAANAQVFAYVAFGDSITRGKCDNGTCSSDAKAGYPTRLATLLGCDGSVCSVDNEGKDGERTSAGVTRIVTVLNAGNYDVLLLMHGTNDIWNNVSNNTIQANLEEMENKATTRDVDTVHASIIRWHPDGPNGTTQDADIADLRTKVADLASASNGYFVDTWAVLCPTMACFNAHYASIPPDNGLHPDASGYDIMAAEFEGEITSTPTPGSSTPLTPSGDVEPPTTFTWSQESPQRATWYEVSIDGPGGNLFSDWVTDRDQCGGGTCSISPTISWTPGDYSWRVRGRNPKGRSAWSADESFRVISDPPDPATTIAPEGTYFTQEPPEMVYIWNLAANATDYRLQVRRFGALIVDQTYPAGAACNAFDCQATAPGGLSEADYTWRVQSSNSAGTAAWSPSRSFSIVDIRNHGQLGIPPLGSPVD